MCGSTDSFLQDQLSSDSGARVCFGCGADNANGLRIKSWMDGETCLCHFLPKPHHTAFPGVVNGGIIATILDCHGVWTAVGHYKKFHDEDVMFVTAKLSVEYLKPTPIGEKLLAKGRVTREGRRSAGVTVDLTVGEQITARAELVVVRHDRSGVSGRSN